ncbi:Pyruvate dehydrogenase E1 component subunit beta, partial [Geodia barretti]
TSGSTAACFGPPRACRRSSVLRGASTLPWPRVSPWVARWAWRSRDCVRWWRSSPFQRFHLTRCKPESSPRVTNTTRTQGAFTAPLVIRMPYGGGVRALEHHSESMEAILAHVPGIKVVIPSTPHDAKGLLIAAIRDPDPVIFMEPKRVYQAPRQEIPEGDFVIPLGTAKLVLPGSDLTIVSYGAQMKEAIAAARQLRDEASAEVIDLRTIYPPDLASVIESVRKTGRLLVVHEGPRSFGVGAELTAAVAEQAFLHLEAPPARLTGSDIVVPMPRHERHYLISVADIMSAARRLLSY